MELKFRPPALRRELVRKHPGIRILFLEVQFSKKLQFRELARVMSNADPAALLCSNNRNESSVVPGADEEAGSEDANMFSDIDRITAAGHMHVPGCRVSDFYLEVRKPIRAAVALVYFAVGLYRQAGWKSCMHTPRHGCSKATSRRSR